MTVLLHHTAMRRTVEMSQSSGMSVTLAAEQKQPSLDSYIQLWQLLEFIIHPPDLQTTIGSSISSPSSIIKLHEGNNSGLYSKSLQTISL